MTMTWLDWCVIVLSLAAAFGPALFFTRRASKGVSEFFASGQSAPWWLAGISMVATTFSTDTPNLVTNFVRERGVSGNWEWWAFLLTGMLTVFFYAKLWRRSGVITDLEFYELRYSGPSAAFVRAFRAIYLGLFFNCVIMASVTLAAVKIANVMFGWQAITTVLFCAFLNVVFSATAGLWGVMVVDLVQFVIAMTGSFAAAYYALQHQAVGGFSGLIAKVDPAKLSMLPDFSDTSLLLAVLIIPLTIQWWSVWYPGAEPGGGSYVAQRMLASKNESHAMAAVLTFNVLHYALRTWPWLIVALCSLLVYPTTAHIQEALPWVDPGLVRDDLAYSAMLKFLPAGMLGLMAASLLAAYVSTMVTHLNWGASYLVHDLYQRFLRPGATEKHYVFVSRVTSGLLMVLASAMTFVLDSSKESFDLLLSIGAGTGLIYLLRWFWWRINAWSEIAAMVSSFLISFGLFSAKKYGYEPLAWLTASPHLQLIAGVGLTTVVWLAATYLTPATDESTLVRFYRKVRPFGYGWGPIVAKAGVGPSPDSFSHALLGWILSCALVYSALFGVGSYLYGRTTAAGVFGVVGAISAAGLARLLPSMFRNVAPISSETDPRA